MSALLAATPLLAVVVGMTALRLSAAWAGVPHNMAAIPTIPIHAPCLQSRFVFISVLPLYLCCA